MVIFMAGISTESIHGHEYYDKELGIFKVPIYQTAIFEQPDRRTGMTRLSDRGVDLKYSREENPTVRALEKILYRLEQGQDALAFSSGMAAISSVYLSFLSHGDTVLVNKECYGTTQQLALDLSKFGIKTVIAGPDTQDLIENITSDVKLALIETVTNPLLRVIDVTEIAKRCRETGTILVVDNTFATPVLYTPITDGADIVVHSTTKYLAGHNDVVGGAIVLPDRSMSEDLWHWRRKLGSIASPFSAFLILRGISTLKCRFEAQSKSAKELAEFLKDHPKIEEVFYPGLDDSPYKRIADKLFRVRLYGGVVSFKVKGRREAALRVLKSLKTVHPSPSLGGVESLMTYPVWSAAKTLNDDIRRELGITDNLLRLSVGLEDIEDLKEDLDQALSEV